MTESSGKLTKTSGRQSHETDAHGVTTSGLWAETGDTIPSKWAALNALTHGQQVVYAIRCPDGLIKIGCTKRLAIRSYQLHGQILGFQFGDFPDEAAIHDHLSAHVAHGREYYHPTTEVMAVVNNMRDAFGMDHISQ